MADICNSAPSRAPEYPFYMFETRPLAAHCPALVPPARYVGVTALWLRRRLTRHAPRGRA
jgi:hypothetical protein